MRLDYYVYKPKNRKYYVYRLGCDPNRVGRSTHMKTKATADIWVKEHFEKLQQKYCQSEMNERKKNKNLRFIDYAKTFYIWDKCPHVTRYRADGKSITIDHVKIARGRLENYVFAHPIAQKSLKDITIDDIENLKSDLRNNHSLAKSTVNRIMSTVKVVFNEASHRNHIGHNPTSGVGKIKENSDERGIFTPWELAMLFPVESPGPWPNHESYTAFLLAATTGMCRGEVLGLQWKWVKFDQKIIYVEQAKKVSEIGNPKWDRSRKVYITGLLYNALVKLFDEAYFKKPEDYLFPNIDRQPRGFTWWKKSFNKTLDKLGWNRIERHLVPHSFRHTIVTYLRSRGYDVDLIQKVIGHTGGNRKEREKTRTTNIYTHWQEETILSLIAPVEELFETGYKIVSFINYILYLMILCDYKEIKLFKKGA